MMATARRRDCPASRRRLLRGPDRRARDRRGRLGRRRRRRRADDRDAHADGRRRGSAPGRRSRARGSRRAAMKVAIVGGTGSFGRALVERLAALGEQVVIGSRDASRAARARRRLRRRGQGQRGRRPRRRSRHPRDEVERHAGHRPRPRRRDRRDAGALRRERPALRRQTACCPGRSGTSLAEEVAEIVSAPVAAGLQTLAAIHLTQRDPPDEDALDLRGRRGREAARRSSSPVGSSRGAPSTPGRSPTPARSRA